jgi:hypothetical protein
MSARGLRDHIQRLPRAVFRVWSRHAPLFAELSREVATGTGSTQSILHLGPLDPATTTGLTLLVCSYVENSIALDPALYSVHNCDQGFSLVPLGSISKADAEMWCQSFSRVLHSSWDNEPAVAKTVMNTLSGLNNLNPTRFQPHISKIITNHRIPERLMSLLREDHCQDVVNQVCRVLLIVLADS